MVLEQKRWSVGGCTFSDYPENPMYRHLTRYLSSFSTPGVDAVTEPTSDQDDGRAERDPASRFCRDNPWEKECQQKELSVIEFVLTALLCSNAALEQRNASVSVTRV